MSETVIFSETETHFQNFCKISKADFLFGTDVANTLVFRHNIPMPRSLAIERRERLSFPLAFPSIIRSLPFQLPS